MPLPVKLIFASGSLEKTINEGMLAVRVPLRESQRNAAMWWCRISQQVKKNNTRMAYLVSVANPYFAS